mgnify:CR=1 FL=1
MGYAFELPPRKPDGDPQRRFIASMVKLHRVTPERVSQFWVRVDRVLAVDATPKGHAEAVVYIEGIADGVLIYESAEEVCYLIEEHQALATAELLRIIAKRAKEGESP